MKRDYFTEEEGQLLPKVTDAFCRDLAKAAAKQLRRFDPDVREAVLMCLQDATSLYSPYTADMIDERLK